MSIHFSNLEDYYNQYVAPRADNSFSQKVKTFFSYQKILKIIGVLGFILAAIGVIGCLTTGMPLMNFTHAFGIIQGTGTISTIISLFFICVDQHCLLNKLNDHIGREIVSHEG